MKEEKDISNTMYISMKFPISRGAVYGKYHFNMGREGKEGEGRRGGIKIFGISLYCVLRQFEYR